ncbi:hypothetical protein IT407_00825 [Candidatus Uhrbacteria bacterium]|nr:hypothetical protein [Candidatus Uhrbacteria bacterium]
MAIKYWLAYLYQQCAAALAALCFVLVAYEIALPGSILPYFNLHILVITTLIVCLLSPAIHSRSLWTRLALLIPSALLLIGYLFLALWEGGIASRLIFAAFAGLIVLVVIALCHSREGGNPVQKQDGPSLKRGDTIKVIEVEEEVSIFMN